MSDPYLIPGTNVLRNRWGLVVHDEVEKAMATLATLKTSELPPDFENMDLSLDMLRAIHRHLFEDLFDWAGEPRDVTLAKQAFAGSNPGSTTTFIPPDDIKAKAAIIFTALSVEDNLVGLPFKLFIRRAADYYAQLNLLHPFREGNGRAQRLLFQYLARRAGHSIALDVITSERWVSASIAGALMNLRPFESLFRDACDPECTLLVRDVVQMLKFVEPNEWNARFVGMIDAGSTASGLLGRAHSTPFITVDGEVIVIHPSEIPADALSGYRRTVHAAWLPASLRAAGEYAVEADLYRQSGSDACRATYPMLAADIDRVDRIVQEISDLVASIGLAGVEASRFKLAIKERALAQMEWSS